MKSIQMARWVPWLIVLLTAAQCGPSVAPETEVAAPDQEAESAETGEKEAPEPLTGKHLVKIETGEGDIVVELDADLAPKTVENFLRYVDRQFYDRTVFHRVVRNQMIQAGGYSFDTRSFELKAKLPGSSIENESDNGLKNVRGAIAMARSSEPDSATSQFFINLRDNPRLDRGHPRGDGSGYCVFGKVVEGMDVVETIGKVETGSKSGLKNVPNLPVFVRSIRQVAPESPE